MHDRIKRAANFPPGQNKSCMLGPEQQNATDRMNVSQFLLYNDFCQQFLLSISLTWPAQLFVPCFLVQWTKHFLQNEPVLDQSILHRAQEGYVAVPGSNIWICAWCANQFLIHKRKKKVFASWRTQRTNEHFRNKTNNFFTQWFQANFKDK